MASNLERIRLLTTQLEEADFQVNEYRELLTFIVESAAESILAKDLDGKITVWNPAAEKMYGWQAHEIIGQSVLKIIPDDKRVEFYLLMADITQGKYVKPFVTTRRTKSGKLLNVVLTVSPIHNANGTVIGASSLSHPEEWISHILEDSDEQ
jgi:PAS domain S-box-containing protein